MLALILDIAIVALLLITLVAGHRLHRSLQTFRVTSEEFKPLIASLDHAAQRAEVALGGLRQMAEDASDKLSEEADKTQRLLDELDFMTKRADQLADKLDSGISRARTTAPKPASAPSTTKTVGANEVPQLPKEQRRRAPDLEQRLKNLR